jgi:hypothetical protein
MKRFSVLLLFCCALAASTRARQITHQPGSSQTANNQPASAQPTSAQATGVQPTGPDAPATREDIEAYLQVTHSKEMARNMLAAISKPLHKMMHEEYLKDKDKLPADFEARMDKQLDDLMKNMPYNEMMEAMVPSYQKHLTKGDVAALVAFYSSPTGQKILKEMPQITAEAMQSMMPIMQKYMNTVQQQLQQQAAQMLQQSSPAPAKNTPASPN